MPSCNCTDCGGNRKYGPCKYENELRKPAKKRAEVASKITFVCDCTDCGGNRKYGPCKNDIGQNEIDLVSTLAVTHF